MPELSPVLLETYSLKELPVIGLNNFQPYVSPNIGSKLSGIEFGFLYPNL